MRLPPPHLLLPLLLALPELSAAVSSILGIDLGQEYIKAALVKPGIPIEIVLTKDSRRKEASAIGFKSSRLAASQEGYSYPDRLYGVDAANLAARFPREVYPNLKQLLGKHILDDSILEYAARYPVLNILPSGGRPTTSFQSMSSPPGGNGEQAFTVEELLAMQLSNIQKNALTLAAEKGKPGNIGGVVFSIPAWFTAEEKYSLQLATEMVGLTVLAMVSDGLAVGINYATGRTFSPDEKPETHVIYDMGAGSTTATVVKFEGKSVKDWGRYKKNITEVSVLGAGWDTGLGGDLFNKKIAEHLLNEFIETPKAKKLDETESARKELVRLNGRSAAKIWREASKARHVLSANSEVYVSIESLYEDIDYKSSKITRAQFEEWIEEYADRVTKPLHQALESAGLTLDGIDSIIFHGGGVRVPWVGKLLENLVGEGKISKTVNPDEAAVMGATFRGAALSGSFRVKEIVVNDINTYGVSAKYKKDASSQKEITQTIFPPTSRIGAEKIFPLKLTEDFTFTLAHSIPVSGKEPRTEPIINVITKNLTATVAKLGTDFGCTPEHIRTEFSLRLRQKDGLPEVVAGWTGCDVEYEDIPEPPKQKGKKGKDDKKGGGVLNDVKDFLGLRKKKDGEQVSSSVSSSAAAESSEEPLSSTGATDGQKPNPIVQEGDAQGLYGAGAKKDDAKKYIQKFEKIPLELEILKAGFPEVSSDSLKVFVDKMRGFDDHDAARVARDTAFNDLESTVYKLRDLLTDDSFLAASPSETTSKLQSLVDEASNWLYDSEGGDSAPADAINEKLKTIVDVAEPVRKRMDEHKKRPEQVKLFKEAVKQTKQLVELMEQTMKLEESNKEKRRKEKEEAATASSPVEPAPGSESPSEGQQKEKAEKDDFADLEDPLPPPPSASDPTTKPTEEEDIPPIYSPEDISRLHSVIENLSSFLDTALATQEKLALNVDPVLTVKQLEEKIAEANRAVIEVMTKQARAQEEREKKEKARKRAEEKKEKERKRKEKKEKDEKKKEEEKKRSEEAAAEDKKDEDSKEEVKEKKKHDEL